MTDLKEKKKFNFVIIYIIGFIVSGFFEFYWISYYPYDYFMLIGIGIILCILGYLSIDGILDTIQTAERKRQEQNEIMIKASKAIYLTTKKIALDSSRSSSTASQNGRDLNSLVDELAKANERLADEVEHAIAIRPLIQENKELVDTVKRTVSEEIAHPVPEITPLDIEKDLKLDENINDTDFETVVAPEVISSMIENEQPQEIPDEIVTPDIVEQELPDEIVAPDIVEDIIAKETVADVESIMTSEVIAENVQYIISDDVSNEDVTENDTPEVDTTDDTVSENDTPEVDTTDDTVSENDIPEVDTTDDTVSENNIEESIAESIDINDTINELLNEESPIVPDSPAEESPVVSDSPAKESPVVSDSPAEESPVVSDAPVEESPVAADDVSVEPEISSDVIADSTNKTLTPDEIAALFASL